MDSPVPSHFDNLLRNLRDGTPAQRQQAAKDLRDYGAAAVEPLCLALRGKDLNVRVVAAESLGQVGDECAVQPLMEVLKACFLKAARRIEVLTEQIKSLPLPASAPAPDAAMLPRTADTPEPDVETLPRVVESPHE